MTQAARDVLNAFSNLSPTAQQEVATEILCRSADYGDLPDTVLDELAGDLFHSYDAEEAARADTETR